MKNMLKMAAAAAFAMTIGVSAHSASAVTIGTPVIIVPGATQTVDGWTITAPIGVALTVDGLSPDMHTLIIEKSAYFTSTSGASILLSRAAGGNAPGYVEFQNEAVTNASNVTWNGFQYLLSGTNAQFDGNIFAGPIGTNVSYGAGVLNSGKNVLTYTGVQGSPSIANWGSPSGSNDLVIDDCDTLVGTQPGECGLETITFTEQPMTAVPLPAAAWQSLVGIFGLGLYLVVRKFKSQMA